MLQLVISEDLLGMVWAGGQFTKWQIFKVGQQAARPPGFLSGSYVHYQSTFAKSLQAEKKTSIASYLHCKPSFKAFSQARCAGSCFVLFCFVCFCVCVCVCFCVFSCVLVSSQSHLSRDRFIALDWTRTW